MAFAQLPTEVLLDIGDHVDHKSLRGVCLASRRLMSIFQKTAYHTAELDDTPDSANRLLALASGPRGVLVQEVQYIPRDLCRTLAPENTRLKEDHARKLTSPYEQLASETRRALESLSMFPSLRKFQFDLDDWNVINRRDELYRFGWTDNQSKEYQAFVENSLEAITHNPIGTFSHLEVNGIPPASTELLFFYLLTEWRSLLSSLKTFEISLPENSIIQVDRHHWVLESLPSNTLYHLAHVQN
ncbi:hypothetical protein FSHL1_006182 [Fusarium sambucinum]